MASHAPIMGAPTRATNNVSTFGLAAIYRACRQHDLTYSRFGRNAVRDPGFVRDLRNGREMRPATKARVAAYIASLSVEG